MGFWSAGSLKSRVLPPDSNFFVTRVKTLQRLMIQGFNSFCNKVIYVLTAVEFKTKIMCTCELNFLYS